MIASNKEKNAISNDIGYAYDIEKYQSKVRFNKRTRKIIHHEDGFLPIPQVQKSCHIPMVEVKRSHGHYVCSKRAWLMSDVCWVLPLHVNQMQLHNNHN